MEKAPIICPACGELIIITRSEDNTPIVEEHPDRVTPALTCIARLGVSFDWSLILP